MGTFAWYVARAAGLVAWGLLSASVVWGLALSTRALGRKPRPAWLLDLHRYLGGLATIFTGVHIAAIVADSYVHFDVASVLVPGASSWRPGAVAWGVVGLYLLLAVELTSLARSRLPRKVWRMTHVASFPLFVVATVHLLTAGADAGALATDAVVTAVVATVAGLTTFRVTGLNRKPDRSRRLDVDAQARQPQRLDQPHPVDADVGLVVVPVPVHRPQRERPLRPTQHVLHGPDARRSRV
ncbi:MAG: putative rane protein [Acidimicrobiales bacterium]|jgi:predicted ferric reductase|nr:putative rane protein [Acidimicrobiales bacterium]